MTATKSQLIKMGAAGFTLALVAFVIGITHGGGATARAQSGAVIAAKMVEGEQGWALSEVGLSWTTDAGSTWASINPPELQPSYVRGVSFLNDSDGIVVAAQQEAVNPAQMEVTIFRTEDGGSSWEASHPPLPPQLVGRASISYLDQKTIWVMVENGAGAFGASGELYVSEDGGSSWQALAPPPVGGDVSLESPTEAWIAGGPTGEGLYRTDDGGDSWQQVQVATPSGVGELGVSYGLPRMDSNGSGVLPVTFDGDFGHSAVGVYSTSDAGSEWSLASLVPLKGSIAPAPNPEEVAFSGPRSVVIQDPASQGLREVAVPDVRTSPAGVRQAESQPPAQVARIPASGLPAGVSPVAFPEDAAGSAPGFAVVNSEKCQEKFNCTAYNALLETDDGGLTWHAATIP
jgi:photosystem II stability/assembly factor-like uncharacterized protein